MMAAFICGRRVLLCKNNFLKIVKRSEGGFVVLLPEIGEDLPDKNPLLKEDNLLPEFNSLTVEKCIAAIGKQTIEYEQGIQQIEKQLQSSDSIRLLEDILHPLESLEVPLHTTWGISKVLYFGNKSLMPSKSYHNIHKRARLAYSAKYNSIPIFKACKGVLDMPDLTIEQKAALNKIVLEGKLNGLDLSEKTLHHFKICAHECSVKQAQFQDSVETFVGQFQHKITDANKMKEFPEDFLKSIAVDPLQYKTGPWIITLRPHVVQTFLEYCPDSLSRWNIWQADVSKCSAFGEKELDNGPLVNGITNDKHELAQYLGYKNYVDMSMCTKMAGSLENVYKFFDTLLQRAFPYQRQEIELLNKFSQENGAATKIEQWDVSYWARRQKESLFKFTDESLKEYFPLPYVLQGLFTISQDLFNIKIVERTNVDVWHKDVRFFDVYDLDWSTSESIGNFYFDPYARDTEKFAVRNSGWLLLIRNRSDLCGVKPLTSLIFNCQPPINNKPSLLSFKEVKSLFANFGTMLHQLLTKTKHIEVAGLSNVEWDAIHTSKHLMINLLYKVEVLEKISHHYALNKPLDKETIVNIIKSRNHMVGFTTCKELYLSRFDLVVHSEQRQWEKIMKKIWKQYFVFPEEKKDCTPCSFLDIFVENDGAVYYGNLWSKMLAADVHSAFEEISTEDKDQIQIIGRRYKDTFLSLGGSVPASEVFRRFRGRDPSVKALLKSLNFN